MAAPCALFASCSEYHPQEIIKQVLGLSELPASDNVLESVQSSAWHINTKYYTANVQLCSTTSRTIGDQTFAESVQAFIVYFDSNQSSSFDRVKSWLPYLRLIEPAIQLLVCDRCSGEHEIDRITAQKFCIENSFELVELNPEETSDSEEDDFPETTGVKRIIQALEAHTWPNLILKDEPDIRSPYFLQLMKDEAALISQERSSTTNLTDNNRIESLQTEPGDNSSVPDDSSIETDNLDIDTSDITHNRTDDSKLNEKSEPCDLGPANADHHNSVEGANAGDRRENVKASVKNDKEAQGDALLRPDEADLLADLGKSEAGGESMEQIFSRLSAMKEKAENLPFDERKSFAEKVALTFWDAIGGGGDEVEGLSDSD